VDSFSKKQEIQYQSLPAKSENSIIYKFHKYSNFTTTEVLTIGDISMGVLVAEETVDGAFDSTKGDGLNEEWSSMKLRVGEGVLSYLFGARNVGEKMLEISFLEYNFYLGD
jgi:hypothetical protein